MYVPSPEIERNINYNVRHGVASVLAANLVTPFLGIFALKLGASNVQVGLLSSAPAVVSLLVMIPGAMYVDRFAQKKRITTRLMLATRTFFLVLACVPFLDPSYRAAALVVAVAAMNLPGAVSNVAWQSFISRVIPPERRAKAFARRNRAMNIIGTVAVLIAGRALDIVSFPLGYQLAFGLAFVVAMVELNIFQKIEEPEGPEETAGRPPGVSAADITHGLAPSFWRFRTRLIVFRGSLREAIADIAAHPRFIHFTIASIIFHFMWQIAWPLFTLYQVNVLGANNLWISLLSLANTGGAVVGYGFWASFAERNGHLKTLFVSTLGIFIVPVYYALSASLVTITVLNLVTGVIVSGVILSLFNALLEQTPEEHRTTYIAYYNSAITCSAVFAPMVGVALLNLTGFSAAFLICGVGRVIGSLAFYVVWRAQARGAAADPGQPATGGGLPA